METYEVVVLSDAQADIENIANYIVDNYKNEELAFALIVELWAKIRTLDFMPDRYGIDEEPELQKRSIRHIRHKQYTIYYFIEEKQTKIKNLKLEFIVIQMRHLWMLLKDIYIKLEKKGKMLFLFLMEDKFAQKICQKKLVKCI